MFRKKTQSTVPNQYSVETWLNPRAPHELIQNTTSQIASETRERLFKDFGSTIDYGYSFPGLNEMGQVCLEDIRDQFQASGKRPRVADIGAGFGNMTWKLLAAGAAVDAFELQAPTAKELHRRLQDMELHFWEGASLKDILSIVVGDAISALKNPKFSEKYDFIWLGSILHFLTPTDLKKLNHIFQQVLKPNGKVFAETNTLTMFSWLTNYSILQTAYDLAKMKKLEFPGFLVMNAATLIDDTIDKVVASTCVSVLDTEDMARHAIPCQVNAYGKNHLGAVDVNINEKCLSIFRSFFDFDPTHEYRINPFHQVMHLLDETTALDIFTAAGFENIDARPPHSVNNQTANLVISFKKSPNLTLQPETSLADFSFLSASPHHQLRRNAEALCKDNQDYTGYLKAIKDKNYSLALRKACGAGVLSLVNCVLKYKTSLDIDINQPSSSNGWTALDWIENNETTDPAIKVSIIHELAQHKAEHGTSAKPQIFS
jgi:SAM-dependent methyltransferase